MPGEEPAGSDPFDSTTALGNESLPAVAATAPAASERTYMGMGGVKLSPIVPLPAVENVYSADPGCAGVGGRSVEFSLALMTGAFIKECFQLGYDWRSSSMEVDAPVMKKASYPTMPLVDPFMKNASSSSRADVLILFFLFLFFFSAAFRLSGMDEDDLSHVVHDVKE